MTLDNFRTCGCNVARLEFLAALGKVGSRVSIADRAAVGAQAVESFKNKNLVKLYDWQDLVFTAGTL